VLNALILRDIRTRFFGHGLGFTVAIAWPLAHIASLLAIYAGLGRIAPYGDSLVLFFSTGLVPFMMFNYMSRFIMAALILNRPLLAFPAVRILDILFARAILEVLGSCCGTVIVLLCMWVTRIDVVPLDIGQAYLAMGASLLIGLGFGMLNGLVTFLTPMWLTGYTLFLIGMYLTCGIVFVPSQLPEPLRTIVSYNPMLHAVEWMRTSYYLGYPSSVLDKAYLVEWGVGTIFLTLVIERAFRGRLLQN